MDNETLAALKGSIAKWEGIVAGTETDKGCHNCPLCKLFHKRTHVYRGNCQDCPVRERTGETMCLGTPYVDHSYASMDHGERSPQAIEAAQRELEFLRSLLPQDSEQNASEQEGTHA